MLLLAPPVYTFFICTGFLTLGKVLDDPYGSQYLLHWTGIVDLALIIITPLWTATFLIAGYIFVK